MKQSWVWSLIALLVVSGVSYGIFRATRRRVFSTAMGTSRVRWSGLLPRWPGGSRSMH